MQFATTHIQQFSGRILVRCPRCPACACLRRLPRDDGYLAGYRLVCPGCGHVDEWLIERDRVIPGPGSGPKLPGFGLSLWLQSPCCHEILWAYNAEHLAYLERFVAANLRERRFDRGCSNASLASRLPRWMTAGKNRGVVMRRLAALRRLVPLA